MVSTGADHALLAWNLVTQRSNGRKLALDVCHSRAVYVVPNCNWSRSHQVTKSTAAIPTHTVTKRIP